MTNATRAGGAIAAVCLLAATACSSDGPETTSESPPTAAPTTAVEDASDEPTTTEPPETTPSTAAPTTAPPAPTEPEADEPPVTTTAAESTLPPSRDTVEVPFYVIDSGIPADLTCREAIPGFNVSFSDESGESTVVEARYESDFLTTDEVVNATCTEDLFDGVPALFYAAVLDAPAAETYESIELRYPFTDTAGGNDRFDTVFEMVTQAEAEAGLGVNGQVPLDPSEIEDFPLPD